LDAHRYFKERVEENPTDNVSKTLMVDCLKVAQTSKQYTVRVITLMSKMNEEEMPEKTKSSGSTSSVFSELDNMIDE
jgi:hypothetical protein